MKKQLKDNIIIQGFDSNEELYLFKDNLCIIGEPLPYIWLGKTSEIPENIAKECVKWNHIVISATAVKTGSGQTYKDYSGEKQWYIYSAKESIQSACNQEYCIIYKEE